MKFLTFKNLNRSNTTIYNLISLFFSRFLYGVPTLISLPFLINIVGSERWTDFAVAQVIGSAFGIFVEAQWKNAGVKKILKASSHSVDVLIISELINKFRLLLMTVVPMTIAMMTVFDKVSLEVFLAAFSTLTASLSMELALSSRKNFSIRFWTEPVVRIFICLFGMNFFEERDSISIFFTTIMFGNIILPLITVAVSRSTLRNVKPGRIEWFDLIYAGSRVISSSYTILPLIALSTLNVANLFMFALADKIFRFIMTFYLPFFQIIQSNTHTSKNGISQNFKAHFAITGIFSLLFTFLVMYTMQKVLFDINSRINLLTILGFSMQSAFVNMNRFSEIVLTEIAKDSKLQSKIFLQSTFLFWAIFSIVFWQQSYYVCIFSCICVELFGIILRAKIIAKNYIKKSKHD